MTDLKRIVAPSRGAFLSVALLSGVTNVLALTGSIFMLVVYDRVIPSGSVPTLVVLVAAVLVVYGFTSFVDIVRSRILTRIGIVMRDRLSRRSFDILLRATGRRGAEATTVIRDVDKLSGFFSSSGLVALFDLPWMPIYLAVCFAFHVDIGLCVVLGAAGLLALTAATEIATRAPAARLDHASTARRAFVGTLQANIDSVRAMGIATTLAGRWQALGVEIDRSQRALADRSAALSSVTRSFRMAIQSVVLAVGAYLVMRQEATGGVMIASSILSARALAPLELAIGQWKSFFAARMAWKALLRHNEAWPEPAPGLDLPRPSHLLSVEKLTIKSSDAAQPLLREVSFVLGAGEALAVIGPTGSGKSTLARALVCLQEATEGSIRLDGMQIGRWQESERGRFIGYLSQQPSLLSGTIAENIARFDRAASVASVLDAARAANVHELITRLPQAYDSRIGVFCPSGGQLQRICLARALHGDPFLLVLDEPNSNLDQHGDSALNSAIQAARDRGAIVVVVSHRPGVLAAVSHVAILEEGKLKAFGPRDQVLGFANTDGRTATPKRVASSS